MKLYGHLGYVPVQLIQYCTKTHIEKVLRSYLALKYGSENGVLVNNRETRLECAYWLDVTERTMRNHIQKMVDLSWASMGSNNILYIRGYGSLQHQVAHRYRKRVELHSRDLGKNVFNGYLLGAVISYFIDLKWLNETSTGSKIWGSYNVRKTPRPFSYTYINSITGLCEQEISNRLKVAEKYGYVKREPKYTSTTIDPSNIHDLRANFDKGDGWPFIKDGKIHFRQADQHYKRLQLKRSLR